MDEILAYAKRTVKKLIRNDLRCGIEDIETHRYYLRCSAEILPLCLETGKNVDIKPIVSYLQANHNPSTGLPFPIDLIDMNVTLPARFTQEFMEEILAHLIGDKDMREIDLQSQFMSINPQKEE